MKVKVGVPEKAGSEGRKSAVLIFRRRVFQEEKMLGPTVSQNVPGPTKGPVLLEQKELKGG